MGKLHKLAAVVCAVCIVLLLFLVWGDLQINVSSDTERVIGLGLGAVAVLTGVYTLYKPKHVAILGGADPTEPVSELVEPVTPGTGDQSRPGDNLETKSLELVTGPDYVSA